MTPAERFLAACRRQPVDTTPVWFHRQAGRYMPRYAALASRLSFLEMCEDPDVVADVTIEPVEAHGVDAAILFADIMLIPRAMLLPLHFERGPVIERPLRTAQDIAELDEQGAMERLQYVFDAVKTTRRALRADTPLIGFAGAPFTVASYMIEGKGGNLEVPKTKFLFRSEPELWAELMGKLTRVTIDYLVAQVENGAAAIELFDSWAGTLTPNEYEQFVLPWSTQIFHALKPLGVPTIHFGVINGGLLEQMALAGSDVVGVDWRTPLDAAWQRIGYDRAIQGNLDPSHLEGNETTLAHGIAEVLRRAAGRDGHVFNLGHGVNLGTDPGMVKAAVDLVHELGRRA